MAPLHARMAGHVDINLNGQDRSVDFAPGTSLLQLLRTREPVLLDGGGGAAQQAGRLADLGLAIAGVIAEPRDAYRFARG